MLIQAQFPSVCPGCDRPIAYGASIQWAPKRAYHPDCAPADVIAHGGGEVRDNGASRTYFPRRGRGRSAAPAVKDGTCGKCGKPCKARYPECYACSHGLTTPAPVAPSDDDAADTIHDMAPMDPNHAAALAAIPF